MNANEQMPPRGVPMQMKAMAVASEEALPVEPGKGTVSVNVSGTVQMNR